MGSYMPTLADYSEVSRIQSQSLALLYRWPKFQETFSGGAALTNSVGGGGGAGLKKNLQIWDLHLWEWSHIINNLHSGQKIPQYPGVLWLSMVLADLFFHYLHKYYKGKMLLAHLQVYWKPWILNWNCGCNCKYLKIDTLTCSLMKEA